MRVLSVDVHNVMAVKDVKFDLDGHHLFLVGGKNGQGKTSALTALCMALCGRSGMEDYPDVALKEGEQKGWVKVTLSGDPSLHEDKQITVELLLVRKRSGQIVEEFRVVDSAGEEAPSPRQLLKDLYSMRAFDPLSFERLDKKAKRATVEKLLGLDFGPSNKRYEEKYAERALLAKQGKEARARFDKMPSYEGAPDEPLNVDSLIREANRRREVNKHNDSLRQAAKNAADSADKASKATAQVEKKIAELQRELLDLKEHEEKTKEESKLAQDRILELADSDVASVEEQISKASEINIKVMANQQKKSADADLERLRKAHADVDKAMQEIKDTQTKMLLAAEWPVEGMGMDEDGITFNGLPFEQASKALRTRVSVAIGMALNPTLRLLVCQSGGDCDEETLSELDKMLSENDFQMIMEIVTRGREDESRCAVIMRDGQADGAESEAADETASEPASDPAGEEAQEQA